MKIHVVVENLVEEKYMVKAFVDKSKADSFCAACNAHKESRPAYPKFSYSESEIETNNIYKFNKDLKFWKESHPAYGWFDNIELDGNYQIEEVELEQ